MALVVGLAACGSSSSKSSSTSSGGSGGGGGAGLSAAKADVEAHRKESNAFVAPGPKVDGSSVKGKSVWYVPIGAAIPVLQGEAVGIQQAAKALGMSYKTCDGKLQAASQAACIKQAANAGAGGIITDSIDLANVGTAASYAKSKNVPIIAGNEVGPNSPLVQYATVGGDFEQQPVAMNWIIADSGGKANVLSTKVIGDKATASEADNAAAVLKKNCPGCKQTIVATTAAQLQTIGSAVSSALLKNPNVDYGLPQFDFLAPLFQKGMQTAGKRGKIKVVSTNAVLSQMQEIKAGTGQVADAGANRNYLGWQVMDRLVRMIAKQAPPTKTKVPVRLFDKTNIDSIKLDAANALTGVWWGPITYQSEFKKIWGVS